MKALRFRKEIKFSTTEQINAMTTAQLVKDANRVYIVKHSDGYEQGLHWNTNKQSKAKKFKSYCCALGYANKDSQILQSY